MNAMSGLRTRCMKALRSSRRAPWLGIARAIRNAYDRNDIPGHFTFEKGIEMLSTRSISAVSFLAIAAGLWSAYAGARASADPLKEIPKEVRALEGTYKGAWTMYGIDDKGESAKRMAWTDAVTTTGAEIKDDRVYVTWTNEQTFEGTGAPSRKTDGKEGYYVTKEGTLGDYFIEMFGQPTRVIRVAENVWSYAMPAAAQELSLPMYPEMTEGHIKAVGQALSEVNMAQV